MSCLVICLENNFYNISSRHFKKYPVVYKLDNTQNFIFMFSFFSFRPVVAIPSNAYISFRAVHGPYNPFHLLISRWLSIIHLFPFFKKFIDHFPSSVSSTYLLKYTCCAPPFTDFIVFSSDGLTLLSCGFVRSENS